MKSYSKSLLFLVAGVAAGALAGLLLAPEEGSKTRKKLSKKAKKLKKSFEDTASGLQEKVTDLKEDLTDKANDLKKVFR